MKAAFPRMGETWVGFTKTMEGFGHEVLIPKALSKKTIQLGVKHSPEYACWPLKLSLASLIESLEMGAEVIGTLGGSGPCRAGWYGEIQKKILVEELGYKIEHFYPMYGVKELKKLAELGGSSTMKMWKVVYTGWQFQKATEHFEKLAIRDRCREEHVGEYTKVYNEIIDMIMKADTTGQLGKVVAQGDQMMADIPKRTDFKPLKIGTVGEIFVVIDPFANLEIEKKLGDLGMEVDRSIYLSDWIWREIVMSYYAPTRYIAKHKLHEDAHPYLNEPVGGDGIESIAGMNVYKRMGYDGVIEISPFTCIPEIVAKSILPTMSRDLDMPYQTFNIDEHTGEAGFITRLEAFGDLLSQRRDGTPLPSKHLTALEVD